MPLFRTMERTVGKGVGKSYACEESFVLFVQTTSACDCTTCFCVISLKPLGLWLTQKHGLAACFSHAYARGEGCL